MVRGAVARERLEKAEQRQQGREEVHGISPGGTAPVLKDFLWTRGGLHGSEPVRCHFDSLPRVYLDGQCDPNRGTGPSDT